MVRKRSNSTMTATATRLPSGHWDFVAIDTMGQYVVAVQLSGYNAVLRQFAAIGL